MHTRTDKEIEARNAALQLALVPGIGPRTYQHLIEAFGDPQKVLEAAPSDIIKVPGVGRRVVNEISRINNANNSDGASGPSTVVRQQLEICAQQNIEILVNGSPKYPKRLTEIYDPPSILFAQGGIGEADSLAIAIVGTRHASRYGLQTAERLATGLSFAGFTIVSGLARGIDAAAHRAALKAGGRTIAVLGSGLLNLYPPENAELASEIAHQGAVVSEYLPHQPPKSGAFPQRNRIVTGLSLGVIVVEAAERSGALISARLADEQGREVFAVPGRIDSRGSRGCHALIRDGARLVESVDDVLDELGPMATPTQMEEQTIRRPAELRLTDQESLVLQQIDNEPTAIDDVIEKTELPSSRVLSTISVLEIRHLVRRVGGNRLVRL